MKHYCKSPWMSLFVYDDGKVKSCCAGQWDWGNLKEQSLEEILNSPKVKKLKEDIINNVPNDYCSYCKGCEDNAGESQRQYFKQFHLDDSKLARPENFDLMMVDMRWNNLCNLNCAYCDTLWSTTWQKIKGFPITDLKANHYSSVLKLVKDSSDNMQAIIMGGGEPLLHTQNIELLQSLNDDVHIDIMTNLSINLNHSRVFKELSKKNNVNWCVSFENTGNHFEFVRHGATWERMLENLQTIKKFSNHSRMIKPTYNLLCATNLVELYKFANSIDFSIHWQTLIHPEQLCVKRFSKEVRNLCVESIDKLFKSEEYSRYLERDEFSSQHSEDFLNHIRNELLEDDQDFVPADSKFRTWLREYQLKYVKNHIKPFGELWPNLDRTIFK